jgi:hypothetical protein
MSNAICEQQRRVPTNCNRERNVAQQNRIFGEKHVIPPNLGTIFVKPYKKQKDIEPLGSSTLRPEAPKKFHGSRIQSNRSNKSALKTQ